MADAARWDALPIMLTLKETARVARVSDANAYEAARSGSGWLHGIAVKVGNQWRIPRDRLRALLEGTDL